MRVVPCTVVGIWLVAAIQIITDFTADRTTGATEKICINITDARAAAQKNFTIACGDVFFTMRHNDRWSSEFRRLSRAELMDLYTDRPFMCRYSYEMIDTWYSGPMVSEYYRDCHQVPSEKKVPLRWKRLA